MYCLRVHVSSQHFISITAESNNATHLSVIYKNLQVRQGNFIRVLLYSQLSTVKHTDTSVGTTCTRHCSNILWKSAISLLKLSWKRSSRFYSRLDSTCHRWNLLNSAKGMKPFFVYKMMERYYFFPRIKYSRFKGEVIYHFNYISDLSLIYGHNHANFSVTFVISYINICIHCATLYLLL